MGAAENGLMEGRRCGAKQTGFLRPLQAAALKHHPRAADFDRGEAPRAVARCGLEAFGTITQTRQLSICGRNDMSSPHSHAVSQCREAHVLVVDKRGVGV